MNEYQHRDLSQAPQPSNQVPVSETASPNSTPLNPTTLDAASLNPGSLGTDSNQKPIPAGNVNIKINTKPDLIITKRMKFTLISTLVLSALVANFVLWSGFALGFFITVIVSQIAVFTILPKPNSKKIFSFCLFLSASIIGLGLTYFLYSDTLLAVVDFFVLIFLIFLQLLIYSETTAFDWDQPGFIAELFISPFARPFVSMSSISKVGRAFKSNKNEGVESSSAKRVSVGLKILLGLLMALPVMVLVILLLSSADVVFKMIFNSFIQFISSVSAAEIIFTVIFTGICFPFVFSLFFSYLTKWKDSSISKQFSIKTDKKEFSLDSVVVATFLFCVNILYAVFAYVQFSTLFGAFQSALPQNITYAEYARQGFFQLVAIASINLVFVILSVLLTRRNSISGIIVRIMSILLIAFTFVMLASAGYRMKMYIEVFSLSKLRVLVSIFMGLIAILLLLALIKEFSIKFKFFKASIIASILVLLFTNFINTNAFIAKYNTEQYLNKEATGNSSVYLFAEKSRSSSSNSSMVSSSSTSSSSSLYATGNFTDSSSNIKNSISSSSNSINNSSSLTSSAYSSVSSSISSTVSSTVSSSVSSSRADADSNIFSESSENRNASFDSNYIINELSFDSIIYIIPLLDTKDISVAKAVKSSLLNVYEYQLKDYNEGSWRKLSFSKENAKKAIENYFGKNLAKELEIIRQ